jgi:hypothetical protein
MREPMPGRPMSQRFATAILAMAAAQRHAGRGVDDIGAVKVA